MVLGASRSGTSLMMQLLEAMGVFVGRSEDLKGPDKGNKNGYFEYRYLKKYSQQLDKFSYYGQKSLIDKYIILPYKKIRRLIIRIKMANFLINLNKLANDSWALKIPPLWFPLWRIQIPKFKLIIVYRHPIAVAHSSMKLKRSRRRFWDYILDWEQINRELIYYFYEHPSILINYEDLMDPNKRAKVLEGLIKFTKRGQLEKVEKVVNANLNRANQEVDKIIRVYPLPEEIKNILKSLEQIKYLWR